MSQNDIAIDTSALFAILSNEPERQKFNEIIAQADNCYVSAGSMLELRIVLFSRFGDNANLALDAFLLKSGICIIADTAQSADIAFSAFRLYGKGTGHGAGLNFGDCFAYALSKSKGIPLLFKGNDFSQTDIVNAATGPTTELSGPR